MIVQKRDEKVIQRIYEHQFLLVDHVAAYFKRKSEAYRRVKEMERAGLIYRESLFTFGRKSALRVTKTGEGVALNAGAYVTPQAKRIDQGTAEHDCIVAAVRMRLERFLTGVWVPERWLKQEGRDPIPDGIFELHDGKKVRVEIENSFKGRSRVRHLLRQHKNDCREFTLLLYVATTQTLFDQLIRCCEGFEEMGFMIVTWDELREKDRPSVWTPRGIRKIFGPKEEK